MPSGSQNTRSKDKSDKAEKAEKADRAEKTFSIDIKQLIKAAEVVLQHSKTLDAAESLQRQVHELTQQLKEANAKVEQAQKEREHEESANHTLTKLFEQRFVKWKEKEDALETQIEEQRREADANLQRKDQECDGQVQRYERKLRKLEEELGREKKKNADLEYRLQHSEKDLKNLRGDFQIKPLEEEDFFESFKHLDSSLFKLTERYFKEPLQASDRGPHPFRHASHLMLLSYTDHRTVPRARAAQSCIAGRLASHVFQPLCIGSPKVATSMGDALQKSRKIRPRQKAILRSLLFTAFEADEESLHREIVQSVASELFQELKGLLSPKNDDAFSKDLLTYLETAARVWNQCKKGTEWIVTSDSLHKHPQAWKLITGDSKDAIAGQASDHPGLVIFPQVYIDGNESTLYPGTMWSFDSAAVEEMRNEKPPRPRRVSVSRSSKSPTVAEASSDPGDRACRGAAMRDRVSEPGRRVSSDSEGQRRCKSTS
ncbi:hypothetical protein ASPBRDRAFT_57932 [Aspergillus brasiliensis CBS 101740]|uniref:Uncharacterized protein n=1 Tax=Aspergillus brasiliensis (strain CBS 101740 / IMI 381727 / IBT 21946) TaxID=767769 RepID=A0A1L9UAA0_ASPBC|nr:hypothetical protein ASPBRDRAFT_57932 [Aspergillus brasiliensis CBS 101740]